MSTQERKPRILCVDDEPELLQGLKLQLRKVATVELAERG
ncbi:MAG: CheY-like chemotaxis protein [Acidimicrobiales bacterium]|jgi:CheY-like chemotaxis protein